MHTNFLNITTISFFCQKGVYPYEYMDDRKKSNETLLSEKEAFDSHLNMGNITDADYVKILK